MEYVPLVTYFAIEDEAETKSEYFDGVIAPMSHPGIEHICITSDLIGALGMQLRRSACEGFSSPLRVYSAACNAVLYPNLTVACDTPQFAKTRYATLLNPTLIIEVYSEATEANDRGKKFISYRTLPSLSAYVLIAENQPRVEVYTRLEARTWNYNVFDGLEAVVPLPAIGCELRLADVYYRVPFSPPPQTSADVGSD